jgi:monoterpene epsilon-lactone hydrolase
MDQPTEVVFNHLRSIADQAFKLIHDIDARRKLIEQYFCVHPSTSEIHGKWYPVKTDHISMEWIVADGADPDRRILYMHGGSWISGSPAGYRAFLSRYPKLRGQWCLLWIIVWHLSINSQLVGRLHAGLSMDAAKRSKRQGTSIVRVLDG